MKSCPTCGQSVPEPVRRDPPLPPLDHSTLVTIHDLPPGTPVEIDTSIRGRDSVYGVPVVCRKLKLPFAASVDTDRMVETGTGSGRSLGSAVGEAETPNLNSDRTTP